VQHGMHGHDLGQRGHLQGHGLTVSAQDRVGAH
jgi:hypothetical protein